MVSDLVIYLVGVVKIIQHGKVIIPDVVTWVGFEFLAYGGSARCSSILLM